MPGWLTNGLPAVGPALQNTTTVAPPNGTYTNLTASALIPVDTEGAAGVPPQTVAATAFQVACEAMGLIENTATSTVHAATLNTVSGLCYTEALTTAAGADYTFTLTNSLLSTSVAAPQVQVRSGTNTAGTFNVKSVVNGSGNTVITITNTGTAAFNGTLCIGFHV